MDDDDKGFFILVLGVLAAILMVVSWWFIQGNDPAQLAATATPQIAEDGHDGDADAGHDDDAAADADAGHDDDAAADADAGHDDDAAADADAGADGDAAADADADAGAEETAEEPADEEPAEEQATEGDDAAAAAAAAVTVGSLIAGDGELGDVADVMADVGVLDMLNGDGPFTVLAPTNGAMASLDDLAADRILFRDGESTMRYHILDGAYSVDDLKALVDRGARSTELQTVHGDPISLSIEGDQLLINGTTAISTSSQGDNGHVHSIDTVLVPRETALNLIVGLDPIQFATASARIDAESQSTLDEVAAALDGNDVAVTVEGHTDNVGDPVLNQNLSQSRAAAVVDYLVDAGIDRGRLSAVGFGPDDPIADNDTEEGRAKNRRIEFSIDN